MAEKAPEKKPESAPPAAAAAASSEAKSQKSGGLLAKTPVLLGVVMVVEAAILFIGFKLVAGGPSASQGATLAVADDAAGGQSGSVNAKKNVEINVVDLKAPNKRSGRTFLYDVSIYLVTQQEHQEEITAAIKSSEALIRDRIRTIVAQSDPEKLGGGSEPGLETLRRQVKYQLGEILGDGLIEEVLIPRCIPFRADF